MPTYEYACSSCDTTHEVQQKMSDPTLTDCPSCGESGLRKLFSGVGIHFKGSGFYRTDSRSKSADSGSSSSSSSSSASNPSSSSSSDAVVESSSRVLDGAAACVGKAMLLASPQASKTNRIDRKSISLLRRCAI